MENMEVQFFHGSSQLAVEILFYNPEYVQTDDLTPSESGAESGKIKEKTKNIKGNYSVLLRFHSV